MPETEKILHQRIHLLPRLPPKVIFKHFWQIQHEGHVQHDATGELYRLTKDLGLLKHVNESWTQKERGSFKRSPSQNIHTQLNFIRGMGAPLRWNSGSVSTDSSAPCCSPLPCCSQETEKSLRKLLEPTAKPNVIDIDNSLEFGKVCEELSWNHCTSTPHRSETNGIAERAVRRILEGTSAVLCNPSWTKSGGLIPWNAAVICETFKISWQTGKYLMNGDLENQSKDSCRFDDLRYHPILPKSSHDCTNLVRNFCQETAKDMYINRREEFGKETSWSQTLRSWKIWPCHKSVLGDSRRRRYSCRKMFFQSQNSQVVWKRLGFFRKFHLSTGPTCTRRRTQRRSSRRVGRVSTVRHANGWPWSQKQSWVRSLGFFFKKIIVITLIQE